MNYVLGLLIINVICVGITDKTDAPDLAKKIVSFIFTKGKIATANYEAKLLTCSLCQTFWLSNIWMIYCLCISPFNILMFLGPIINALATTLMNPTIDMIMDIYKTLINIIQCILTKINRLL